MSLDLKFIICGVRYSEYSHAYLSRLLSMGHHPYCILSIDPSLRNQANSRSLMARGGARYPLRTGAWEVSNAPYCLLQLAAQYQIPYLALADFQCPKLELYLRQHQPSVILATDGQLAAPGAGHESTRHLGAVESRQLVCPL